MVGDWERGREVAGRLLANAKARGSIRDELNAWKLLGFIAHRERDFAEAERYSRLVLSLAQELGDEIELLFAKLNLAVPIMDAGRIEEALPILEDTLAGYRRSGSVDGAGLALLNIGEAALLLGDLDRARASIDEARMAFESVGFRVMVGRTLEKLAWVETRRGNHLEAARLLGRAASVVAEIGAFDLADLARTEEEVRAALGDDAFAVAYEEGRQQADAPG
jgi:tetratricopeptide (TPR) repeat protein